MCKLFDNTIFHFFRQELSSNHFNLSSNTDIMLLIMFNLKAIQKTILFLSIAVFFTSFVLILYFAANSPNGFLANSVGAKPITAFTTTDVQRFSYGEKIVITEDVKIKDDLSTIISQDLDATLLSKNEFRFNGLVYLKNADVISVALSALVNVELSKGEYFINTNPIRIHVLSGEVIYNQNTVANVNQTVIWQVDRFKANTLNTDDFLLNQNYSDLVKLLKEINLLPSQLTDLSLNISDVTTVTVSDAEDADLIAGCASDLLLQRLLCNLNNYRVDNNLKKIILDEDLNQLALSHVIWMDANQSVSTIESNGLSYMERCKNIGIDCSAEINLMVEGYDSLRIFNQIIQNRNILDKDLSLVGVNVSGNYLSILLR